MTTTRPSAKSLLSQPSYRSVTEIVEGSHSLLIQGYSLAKGVGVGKHIASDEFTVGGYRWVICFFPDGEDNSMYVSLFIALASDAQNVRAFFEFKFIDQNGKGHFDRSFESTLKRRGSMCGYKCFISREMLETSGYLKDDSLKINCTVRVVLSSSSRLYSINDPESNIKSDFGMLLENKICSDVVFDVAGEKFHAHKSVLAARSPKFRSEFFEKKHSTDEEIMVPDIEPKVFKAMLKFIYTDELGEDEEAILSDSSGSIDSDDSLTQKLLAAADRYALRRLRQICESHLSMGISVCSVCKILAVAERHRLTELKSLCLRFAAENIGAVIRSDGFESLEESCPALQSEIIKYCRGK